MVIVLVLASLSGLSIGRTEISRLPGPKFPFTRIASHPAGVVSIGPSFASSGSGNGAQQSSTVGAFFSFCAISYAAPCLSLLLLQRSFVRC